MIPERCPVILVRSTLGNGRYVANLTILCRVANSLNLDLRNRLRRRKGLIQRRVPAHIGRRNTVERKLRLRWRRSLNREIVAVIGLHSRQRSNQNVRTRAARRSIVGRKIEDLLRPKRRRDRLRLGRDRSSVRRNVDRRRHLPRPERRVDAQRLPGYQGHFRGVEGLETSRRHLDPVAPRLHVDRLIITVVVRLHRSNRVLVNVDDLDRRPRNDAPRCIADCPKYRAKDRLRDDWRNQRREKE